MRILKTETVPTGIEHLDFEIQCQSMFNGPCDRPAQILTRSHDCCDVYRCKTCWARKQVALGQTIDVHGKTVCTNCHGEFMRVEDFMWVVGEL